MLLLEVKLKAVFSKRKEKESKSVSVYNCANGEVQELQEWVCQCAYAHVCLKMNER